MNGILSAWLHTDNSEVREPVVGVGGSGIILQRGPFAVKIPNLSREVQYVDGKRTVGRLTPEPGNYDERQSSIEDIQHEKAICRRLVLQLDSCQESDSFRPPSLVPYYDLDSAENCIQMKLMEHGDLRHYLVENRPDRKTQLSWLLDLVHTLLYIHRRRVVVCDIRTDNILLDDDFTVKMADFGNAVIMPLDWDLTGLVEDHWSISRDIGAFGAVMHEIVTGKHCHFDLFADFKDPADSTYWPQRDTLPTTDGIWLGPIIERCWTEGSLTSVEELVMLLEQERADGADAVSP